jgi:hypothetical protein
VTRSNSAWAALLVAGVVSSGCGASNENPGMVLPSPIVANVSGMWQGPTTLVSATGGECVGALMSAAVGGVDTRTLAMVQEGTEVTARVTSADTGLGCQYTGRVALNSLALDAASCSSGEPVNIVVQCANGNTRQLQLIGSTITATVAGGVVTGTMAETFNVRDVENEPVAGLVVNRTISATRR